MNLTQESVTYLTGIGISVVLASMLSHSWISKGRTGPMGFWMTAAWMMVLTNCLFAARQVLPFWVGRIFPTGLVTVALGVLLLGANVTAGRKPGIRTAGVMVLVHAVLLAFFLTLDQPTHWRTVSNGAIWAGLSFATFLAFRNGPEYFWKAVFSPANVMLTHALFHIVRLLLSLLSGQFAWAAMLDGLQVIGDLEASMFVVAIYVSILVATMRKDDEELANTRVEMATLSGLLPICAWCKKVRDDDGYWKQVEDYFSAHTHVDFTHSICTTCETRIIEETKKRRGEPDSGKD
jgi:prepilin signal peptidase PulO-like enzyme (type II secretory pathway)